MDDISILQPNGSGAEAQFRDGNLNQGKLKSVSSLVAYVAHQQNVTEEDVRRVVECAFGNKKIGDIEEDNYNALMSYLLDLSENEDFFKDDFLRTEKFMDRATAPSCRPARKNTPTPIITITPEQLRAARAMMNWGRAQCGKIAGVSAETIKNVEKGVFVPNAATVEKLVKTFERHGVSLVFLFAYRAVVFNKDFVQSADSKEPDTKNALQERN